MKAKQTFGTMLILLAAFLGEAQTNLLVNPSFEASGEQIGWSDGWNSDNFPSFSGTRSITNAPLDPYPAPDGAYYAYMQGTDSTSGAYPYQTTGYTIQSGDIFQLTFEAQKDYGSTPPPGNAPLTAPIQLEADVYYIDGTGNRTVLGNKIIPWGGVSTAAVDWAGYSLLVSASADPNSIGHLLGVQFLNATDPAQQGWNWVEVDNVSLVVNPIPEPGMLALFSLGGLGFLMFGRRRS